MAICLFSYLGVETAAVAAAKVRNPERNVPKSTIYGTLASAVGLHALADRRVRDPPDERPGPGRQQGVLLRRRQLDRRRRLGPATWSPLAVIISGIGALNGWTMICAEMPLAAAKDGLFPKRFGTLSGRGVPGVRHHLLDRAGLGRRRDQLHGRQRRHRLHHPGPDDRHHRGRPVRVLRAGPAQVALPRPPGRPHPAASSATSSSPSSRSCFSLAFIYYSRNSGDDWYVVWGPFLMAGGAFAARHPGLPRAAQAHDRARPYRARTYK